MDEFQQLIKDRMAQLPSVVRSAITSADVEKSLRAIAETHKLHLDQWQVLENLVMLTLLGVQQIESLEENVLKQVEVAPEVARDLTEKINEIVFEPIREELERQLEHPEAKEKEVSGVEAARTQELGKSQLETSNAQPASSHEAAPPPSAIQPATPPQGAPDVKVARPSADSNYRPGETSAARAAIHDDPYREPPV